MQTNEIIERKYDAKGANNMKKFEEPIVEVVNFEVKDIITESSEEEIPSFMGAACVTTG